MPSRIAARKLPHRLAATRLVRTARTATREAISPLVPRPQPSAKTIAARWSPAATSAAASSDVFLQGARREKIATCPWANRSIIGSRWFPPMYSLAVVLTTMSIAPDVAVVHTTLAQRNGVTSCASGAEPDAPYGGWKPPLRRISNKSFPCDMAKTSKKAPLLPGALAACCSGQLTSTQRNLRFS